jgi:hypothetical protein
MIDEKKDALKITFFTQLIQYFTNYLNISVTKLTGMLNYCTGSELYRNNVILKFVHLDHKSRSMRS